MLFHEDPGAQGLLRVVVADRHARLRDDRSGVHTFVDEMNGGPRELDAIFERLPLRVQARERGKKGRMDVDQAAVPASYDFGAEDPHEAGQAHEPDAALVEAPEQRRVVGSAVTVRLRI